MAFKKPLNSLKTSAPLRNSDRKKLKQRVTQTFNLESDDGDLVPDGLLSVKFTTHLDEPGVAYLAPDGNPLWFTVGKGSDDLIPTVYTLWKHPSLLPFLSTPAAVIPRLTDGADLMIPGARIKEVVQHTPLLRVHQLVAVTQYERGKRGPPLAVGRMALDASKLRDGAKGKAVHVLHTYKDRLWEMGDKSGPPDAVLLEAQVVGDEWSDEGADPLQEHGELGGKSQATPPPQSESGDTVEEDKADEPKLSPLEVSTFLRTALVQSIHSTLSKLPPSAFPIPSSTFYTAYIMPSRPLPTLATPDTPIDIKHSAYKSLTAFLKAAEKDGLVKLKESKGKGAGELQVIGVFGAHADVAGHRSYKTIGDADARREKQEERAEEERKKVREMGVAELWKPHQQSVRLFAEAGKDTSALYSLSEIKAVVNAYIAAKSLVNAHQQQFINIDDLLHAVLASAKVGVTPDFLKREEMVERLVDKMQAWHRIEVEGRDQVLKKGQLKPVSVVVKIRQGRKACTLLTDFEPYFLAADALADELRRLCASATSVAPLPGKTAGMEVMVQGKQIATVTDFLMSKGVPKKWIVAADLSDKKK